MISLPSKQSTNHLAELDSLRALAVVAVLLYHVEGSWLPGGFTGVDIFFVISGYIVTRATLMHSRDPSAATIGAFFARRFKRIAPALVVCLLATTLLTTLFVPASWLSQSISLTGLYAFFGFSNFALVTSNDGYFSPRIDFNPFTHTWSLAVEEQFYLLFPLLLLLILVGFARSGRWKTGAFMVLGLLTLVSLLIAVGQTTSAPNQAFYWLPSRFWELGIGVMLSLYHLNQPTPTHTHLRQPAIVGGFALIVAGFIYAEHFRFPFPWALLPTAGALLLIHAIYLGTAPTQTAGQTMPQTTGQSSKSTAFSHPMLRYIGLISYSLYLWHWPVYVIFRWTIGLESISQKLAAIMISLVLAILSYELVEQRFKSLRIRNGKHAVGIIAISVLAIAVSYGGASMAFRYQHQLTLSVTANKTDWYAYPQHSDNTDESFAHPHKRIFAIGDSHLGAYATMISQLRQEQRLQIDEFHLGGCPMANFMYKLYENPGCDNRVQQILQSILEQGKAGDIVLFTSLQAMRLADQWLTLDVEGLKTYIQSDTAAMVLNTAYEDSRAVIKPLVDAGMHVVIETPKPTLKAPPYRCSDWFNRNNPVCSEGASINREEMELLRAPMLRSMQKMQQEFSTSVHLWDSFSVLCPGEVCTSHLNERPIFFDADHLSGYGNQLLHPHFTRLISDIWSAPQTAAQQH